MQYFEISNPLPENQYIWTVSGGEFIFNDSTSSVEVIWGDFDLGELCVYAIDDYNCTGLPICKTVDLSTLQLLELESDLINLYPNPSLGMLNLSFEQNRKWEEVLIELYNPLGSRVTTLEFNLEEGEGVKKLDLSFLPEGVYWIKLYTDGKLNSIQKWVLSM
jgi:hypothetical protein